MHNFIKFFIILLFLFFVAMPAKAESDPNNYYYIYLDEPTIAKGYTVAAFDDKLKLSLMPGILSEDTGVDVVELNELMPEPWQLNRISNIYQFEFRNKTAYDNHKPFYIQFSYKEDSPYYKQVYFFDKNHNAWRPLPTQDFPKEKFVRSLIHLPYARIAVFSDEEYLTVGKGSWYAYRGGDFVASPDFPKGSLLRVYNLDYETGSRFAPYVDVEVNDYGPDRSIHPDRPVDLDKVAFGKIASLGAGVVNVSVEPLFTPEGAEVKGAIEAPVANSRAITVIDEKTGAEIYSKNSEEVVPIASLTKMVAIKTFLDIDDNLERVVAYNEEDEKKNYIYCHKWESSKISVGDGDTLTIKDLIYSSLVGSANNSVETLVRVSGISRDDFIRQMNFNVQSWGATSTNFVEPTGLSPLNVSSSQDYAIIMKEVLKNNLIAQASVASEYRFTTLGQEKSFRFFNTNKSLHLGGDLQTTGSKTGYLEEASYCLAIRATGSGESLVAVVLGATSREEAANEAELFIKYSLSLLEGKYD